MKKFNIHIVILLSIATLFSSCARDLSDDVYTSDSTLSLTLQGVILASRPVIVKESDRMSDNALGGAIGAGSGAVLGSTVGKGSGNTLAILGGALGGAAVGAIAQDKLGQAKGVEYIIKIDPTQIDKDHYYSTPAMRAAVSAATTGGTITVVQGVKNAIAAGQRVYVIFSDKRTRVIAAS